MDGGARLASKPTNIPALIARVQELAKQRYEGPEQDWAASNCVGGGTQLAKAAPLFAAECQRLQRVVNSADVVLMSEFLDVRADRDRLRAENQQQAERIKALEAQVGWVNRKTASVNEWCCEAHPDLPWPHVDANGKECEGPGMPVQNRRDLVTQPFFEAALRGNSTQETTND